MTDQYHHGDLRRALLRRAADEIGRHGVAAVSLRALASAEGVSHTAPRHHFGSLDGLLTALAAEGFDLLADRLVEARTSGEGFLAQGLAYAQFAIDHPGHFAVMFDADLVVPDDEQLVAARARAFAEIGHGLTEVDSPQARADVAAATIAAWALVHGLVNLDRGDALRQSEVLRVLGEPDLLQLTERAGGMLFGSPATEPGDQP